jgi:hypothetical protein
MERQPVPLTSRGRGFSDKNSAQNKNGAPLLSAGAPLLR